MTHTQRLRHTVDLALTLEHEITALFRALKRRRKLLPPTALTALRLADAGLVGTMAQLRFIHDDLRRASALLRKGEQSS